MKKSVKSLKLQVSFLREGKRFIAYSPALDLSTSGKDFEETKKRFAEAVKIFFDEILEMETYEDVLLSLGWTKRKREIIPPVVVSQEMESVRIPL